jgi:hypothetical protein
MHKTARIIATVAAALVLASAAGAREPGADTARAALVSLCDPAKIATLKSDRAANPRVRKIAYWLEIARRAGRDPAAEMAAVMDAIGWGGTAKGELTAAAMARNRIIAERLGCLDPEGMERMRRGKSPIIRRGPYAAERLTVDHIIPRAVSPALDLVLANLELMPHSLNVRKGSKVGQRQLDLARKLHAAGMLSRGDLEAVLERGRATVGEVPDAPAGGY